VKKERIPPADICLSFGPASDREGGRDTGVSIPKSYWYRTALTSYFNGIWSDTCGQSAFCQVFLGAMALPHYNSYGRSRSAVRDRTARDPRAVWEDQKTLLDRLTGLFRESPLPAQGGEARIRANLAQEIVYSCIPAGITSEYAGKNENYRNSERFLSLFQYAQEWNEEDWDLSRTGEKVTRYYASVLCAVFTEEELESRLNRLRGDIEEKHQVSPPIPDWCDDLSLKAGRMLLTELVLAARDELKSHAKRQIANLLLNIEEEEGQTKRAAGLLTVEYEKVAALCAAAVRGGCDLETLECLMELCRSAVRNTRPAPAPIALYRMLDEAAGRLLEDIFRDLRDTRTMDAAQERLSRVTRLRRQLAVLSAQE